VNETKSKREEIDADDATGLHRLGGNSAAFHAANGVGSLRERSECTRQDLT